MADISLSSGIRSNLLSLQSTSSLLTPAALQGRDDAGGAR